MKGTQGSLMRFYEYMDIPGIDHLLRDNCCFWIVKQVVSVARQLGKEQILSELYGATGWKTTLEEYKQVGDWQALFGINLRCPHLAWYTMKGEAKRDYPASISYHLAGWQEYRYLEDYFSRIHVFLEKGEEKEELLVICPIESVWAMSYSGAYSGLESRDSVIKQIEDEYERLFGILTKNQIGFDYGEEALMEQHASVKDGFLRIGGCSYKKVIICGMHTMRSSTLELLREFQNKGGVVVFIGMAPEYVDAEPSGEVLCMAEHAVQIPFEERQIVKACQEERILSVSGDGCEDILVCKREGSLGANYMLLNQNRKKGHEKICLQFGDKELFYKAQVLEEWNARTGEVVTLPFEKTKDGCICKWLDFAPGEEKLLRIGAFGLAGEYEQVDEAREVVQLPVQYAYRLSEKNVCVLDQVSVQFQSADGTGHFIERQEVLRSDRAFRIILGKRFAAGKCFSPGTSTNIVVTQSSLREPLCVMTL